MDNDDNDLREYSSNVQNAFSDDPALMDLYFNGDDIEISKGQLKQNPNTKNIKLIHQGNEYEVPIELIRFSQLLNFAFGDEEFVKNEDGENNDVNVLKMEIPSQISTNMSIITILMKFMQVCSYEPRTVKLGKVKSYSVKVSESCPPHITEFITIEIKKLPNNQLNQLIHFCRYMQITSFLEVIYYHLATKYSCPYTDNEAKELMQKYKVKKFNSDEATQMKVKYLDYFKKMTREFIEIDEKRKMELETKAIKEKKH